MDRPVEEWKIVRDHRESGRVRRAVTRRLVGVPAFMLAAVGLYRALPFAAGASPSATIDSASKDLMGSLAYVGGMPPT